MIYLDNNISTEYDHDNSSKCDDDSDSDQSSLPHIPSMVRKVIHKCDIVLFITIFWIQPMLIHSYIISVNCANYYM